MGTIGAAEIFATVGMMLNDTGFVRWTRAELQRHLNDAYRVIITNRPDANAQKSELTLATGAKQSVSSISGSIAVLDVVRNTAATSAGNPLELVPRDVLDTQIPGWRTDTGSIDIEHWVFDVRLPKEFEVYPPAASGAKVEVLCSIMPTQHAFTSQELSGSTAITATISLDDIYAPAIINWMLHRSYSKDDETGDASKANQHLAEFKDFLGIKTSTDLSMLKLPNGGAS